ncbi:MAG: hypothetical protein ACTSRS_06365 [Candidatus Helarchaeota archaeon]
MKSNNLISFGAIGILLWSFMGIFRLFPLSFEFAFTFAIYTGILFLLDIIFSILLPAREVIWLGLILYAIFGSLFFFTSEIQYLLNSYIGFGFLFPRLCQIQHGTPINKKSAGVHAAAFAFGFCLSTIGYYWGVMVNPENATFILIGGVILGTLASFERKEEERGPRISRKLIRKSLGFILGIIIMGVVLFFGITIYSNPAFLCYYTGISYDLTFIVVIISFMAAGILCVLFYFLTERLETKFYWMVLTIGLFGLGGFLLLQFIQHPIILVLIVLANSAIFLGIAIGFYYMAKLGGIWSFFASFAASAGVYALISISGVTYFYWIGMGLQILAVFLLKFLTQGGENEDPE